MFISNQTVYQYGRDSSVGIATLYSSTVWRSNTGRSEIFHTRPYRPWGPPSLQFNWYRVSFLRVKRPGRGVNHPSPPSVEVKQRVEPHLYSLRGPSWPVLERNLPVFFTCISITKYLLLPQHNAHLYVVKKRSDVDRMQLCISEGRYYMMLVKIQYRESSFVTPTTG